MSDFAVTFLSAHLLIDSSARRCYLGFMANKLTVTERALVQRINRRLRDDEEMLRRGRSRLAERVWCRIDVRRNALVEEDVDLEELGRTLGVLQPYERMATA